MIRMSTERPASAAGKQQIKSNHKIRVTTAAELPASEPPRSPFLTTEGGVTDEYRYVPGRVRCNMRSIGRTRTTDAGESEAALLSLMSKTLMPTISVAGLVSKWFHRINAHFTLQHTAKKNRGFRI